MSSLALSPVVQAGMTMSSLEIAEVVQSGHDDVKRSMERLSARGVITLPPLAEVSNPRSGPKMIAVYLVDKRDSYVVVAQLSPEHTAQLVDRWQELEDRAASGGLPNFADPVVAARAWADQMEQRRIAEAQRDDAIRTKALIGSRREATAMATAASAKREAARLKDQLGFNARQATMIAVEKATKRKFDKVRDWRPLKKWCDERGITPAAVVDERYGEAKAWPAAAWLDVFGIRLEDLFPSKELATT